MRDSLTPAEARRVALAAQGFGRPRPRAVTARQLNGTIDRLGLLQLDSVNVFERSHYLPVHARLGPYNKDLLDRLTFSTRGRYLEYWAHEAALIPREWWPLFRWRMEGYRRNPREHLTVWAQSHGHILDWLRTELAEKGPLAASAVEHDANKRSGPWWGWSDVKTGLEALFRWGEVVSAGRSRFERVYGLADQLLPAELRGLEIPEREAQKRLVEHAARAHGIGTRSDIADYFRLKNVDVRGLLHELEEEGAVRRVTVDGWRESAWLHRDARIPRRVEAAAILSPFDPVVWERRRAERLFDFHYRIEIYTPAPKRIFGYYSLPVLLDDRIVGRVDLKSDRQARILRVQSAWLEEGADAPDTAARLLPLLEDAARWQGLDAVTVAARGTLAPLLRQELPGH